MLKLVIADDEKVIREALSTIIDWEKYDIELVRICKNGLETYHAILDECPDIVLTDIRMPHMSGLQIIKNVSEMGLDTQFIILSGYGEFEYAKVAMQYGVKHYLLKPYNEQQLITCIQKTAQDCYQKKLSMQIGKNHFFIINNLQHSVISSIINDMVSQKPDHPESLVKTYEPYMDFYYTPYTLFYIYYLEEPSLNYFLSELERYCLNKIPHHTIHGIYVHNTMILFLKNYSQNYEDFIQFLYQIPFPNSQVTLEIRPENFSNLKVLMETILKKIQRFSIIYYINNFHAFATCNHSFFTEESERCLQNFKTTGNPEELTRLTELFSGISDLNFCRQFAVSLLLKMMANNLIFPANEFTNWIMNLNQENNLEQLKRLISQKLLQIFSNHAPVGKVSSVTRQIMQYVEEHLQDPNLTLKSIAENELYMNVNYISRKFFKDTGIKFSHYLSEIRIMRAKQYLASNETDKIQDIATLVGYGNNPQYFSHLFKKSVGMTPTEFNRSLHQENSEHP